MRISDGSSDGCSSDLLTLVFGVAGYLLRCYNFSPAPLLIGFVLSPMLDENFRRAMIMGRGEASYFFSSAISGTVLALTLVLLFLRSEDHTSELQSLMSLSYDVFCLKKITHNINHPN